MACRDRRALPMELCDVKFLQTKAEDPVRFEGYASVWGRKDAYGDTVMKGAFADSLKKRRPMMFYGHNPSRVPGKWVEYGEDDKGLRMVGELTPGNSEGQNLAASLKHGALNGLSIGGYTESGEPLEGGGRLIKAFDLWEVSPVAMPAEDEARIDSSSVKALLDSCDNFSDFEDLLREAGGFSKSNATALVARMKRLARGEPGEAASNAGGELAALIRATAIPTSITGATK